MRRILNILVVVATVAACWSWVDTLLQRAEAACTTRTCQDKCKVHNRWCYKATNLTGQPLKGFRYRMGTTPTGVALLLCNQNPDGGTQIELDRYMVDRYPNCAKDCTQDTECTGSPSGDIETSYPVDENTKCKSS
jgi:hypothetical protein